MRVVFSAAVATDLADAERYYAAISPKLGSDFRVEAATAVRTIVARGGGDHVGPHGFPARRCERFPYVVYYEIEGEVVRILGIVHERRHPDYLRLRMGD